MSDSEIRKSELLATLAELGGGMTSEEDISFQGTRFVIPETMSIREAIDFLYEKANEDDQQMTFVREFPYRPMDGARSAYNAMKRVFGMTRQTRGMFGEPPQMVTVDVAYGVSEQVPWGTLQVPALPNCRIVFDETWNRDLGRVFQVTVIGPRRMRFVVEGLFALITQELRDTSMYRGQAFDGSGKFLDLSNVDPSRVVYSADVMTQLDANVWSVIRHTDELRKLGVSLKRAVLLEGPYGTGKTLAAYLTAREATSNGWSFVYCRPGDNIEEVMSTARMYAPAVVFIEDIDVLGDASTVDADATSKLLDAFDGIANKGLDVLAVMTTNHVDKLHKGLCRPGRLDAIIHIGALDMHGVEVLIRNVIPSHLRGDIDVETVFDAMRGYLPAFVKEAVERSLRYAIARGDGVASMVNTDDLVNAANGLRAQHDLMLNAEEHKPGDKLSEVMAGVVRDAIGNQVTESMGANLENLGEALVTNTAHNARVVVGRIRDALNSTEIRDCDGDYLNGERLVIDD